MDSVYNNTFVPLNAGQIWEGKSESISKFTVASVSCITDVSGILNLYFSLNNIDFDFVKTYQLKSNDPFIINQKVEGKYFRAKVTNNSGVNQTYLRLTTTYKEDVRSDLDIRPLNSEKDTLSIPALNACISDGKLNVNVEGVTVSGVIVDISGQRVDINGETVKSQLYDSNGYAIATQLVGGTRSLATFNLSGLRAKEGSDIKEINAVTDAMHGGTNLCVYDDVLNDKINSSNVIGEDTGAIKVFVSNTTAQKLKCDISGQSVDISGQTVNIKGSIDISGQRVDISGQIVDISGQRVDISGSRVDISGQRVVVDISGQRVVVDISGQKVDISGQRVITDISGQRVLVDISGQRVDISGQRIVVDISGQRVVTDISGQTVVVRGGVDISGQTIRVSNLNDISGSRVDISGQRVVTDISGQTVVTDISGSRVDISGQRVVVDISGQRVLVDISGQQVDISGQRVVTDISGQKVVVDISGQRVVTDISGQRVVVDISGQTVVTDISGQRVDISGSRVDISGQRVITDISGQIVVTDISGQTIRVSNLNDISGSRVDISGQRVVVDISGQIVVVDISGQKVDVSGQTVRVSNLNDISGVRVDISGQRVVSDISGQRVDISGQSIIVTSLPALTVTSDISGQTVVANVRGFDGTLYNDLYVDTNGFIGTNIIDNPHQDIVYGFDEMVSALTTGSNAIWSKVNPFASDENGWFVSNPSSGFANLLWYNNGSFGNTQAFNFQSEFPFSDIDIWFMIIKNYRPLISSGGAVLMPTIRVYSKDTGSGDALPGVYKSYWDYTITAGQSLNFGESIMIYNGLISRVKLLNTDLRRIAYSLTGGVGTRANTEIINHVAFIYDTPNLYNTLVIEAGIYIKNRGLINYYFSNGYTSKSQIATIAMKTATDTINTNTANISTNTGNINTKLTGMTYTSNRLQTQSTITDGTNTATISTPSLVSGTSTIRALDSSAYVNALDVFNNTYDDLTMTNSLNGAPNGLFKSLDVYARNPTSSVNYSVYNSAGTFTGINTYNIMPKTRQLMLSGRTATMNGVLGGLGCTQTFFANNWGISSGKTFFVSMTAGGAAKTVYYDYIDTAGNERSWEVVSPVGATWTQLPLQLNTTQPIASINSIRYNASFTTADTLYIATSQSTANTIYSATYLGNFHGVLTCPQNAIMYITNINITASGAQAEGDIQIYKYNAFTGARQNLFYQALFSRSNFIISGADGTIGGYILPGESVLMGLTYTGYNITAYANVVVKYLY